MANLSEHDLEALIRNYKLDTFVETGTGDGGGVEYALKHKFSRIVSVDIMDTSYQWAVDKFGSHNHVFLVKCHSPDFIKAWQIAARKPGWRVLWWLDAHFPGVDTGLMEWNDSMQMYGDALPTPSELDAILDGPFENDVIIIDDAFLFRAGIIDQRLSERVPEVFEKSLGTIECHLERMSASHEIRVNRGETGSIVVTPRNP